MKAKAKTQTARIQNSPDQKTLVKSKGNQKHDVWSQEDQVKVRNDYLGISGAKVYRTLQIKEPLIPGPIILSVELKNSQEGITENTD